MARKSQRLRRQRRIERLKAKEQEAKITKVVEDNSVILERMKSASSNCDKVLQKLSNASESEVTAQIIDPQFVSTEPVPVLEEEKVEEKPAKPKPKSKAKRTTRRRRTTTKKKTSEE